MTVTQSYLDISESVTLEETQRVLDSLLGQFESWRISNRWCGELHSRHVTRLSPAFVFDPYGEQFSSTGTMNGGNDGAINVVIPANWDTGERHARELRDLRGRILRFTIDYPDYINKERANDFLTSAGLQPWAPPAESPVEPPATKRMYVSVSTYMEVDTDITEAQLTAKIQRYFYKLGANTGSARSSFALGVNEEPLRGRRNQSRHIPERDTMPLLDRRW